MRCSDRKQHRTRCSLRRKVGHLSGVQSVCEASSVIHFCWRPRLADLQSCFDIDGVLPAPDLSLWHRLRGLCIGGVQWVHPGLVSSLSQHACA